MVFCRRLKTFVWLTAIVVCLQFFVFVADQVWSKNDALIEDCTVSKDGDIILPRDAYKQTPLNTHNSSSPTARSIPTEKTTSRVLEKLTETTNAIPASTPSNATPKPEYNCRRLENRTSLNGFLNLHEWYDWCGHTVDDLRRNPLFPFKPNTNTLLQKFVINDTKGFFNARRIFGYIHPPATGDYVLAVSSADGSDLWLSTDDNPKNSRKIAYIGEPENQYADSTQFLEFTSKKSQISGLIRLETGSVYYVEALQKQKKNRDHIEVAWKKPGSEKLEVIDFQHISQYIDYSADQQEINTRTACICSDHPTLKLAYDEFMTREKYDKRDDFPFRVENLPFSEVSDVLPSCPYHPSYLVSRKLKEDEAIYKGFILQPRVYPDDRTNINMSHDINNHISLGNKNLSEEEVLQIVTEYMNSLKKAKGERFTLKHVVNVEMKEDPKKGKRYFLELELADKERGRSVGFSEYVYKTNDSNSGLCYPEGHQWKRNVSITAIVTVKNYGSWIKYLVDQLAQIYQKGLERNFYLIIADFNSTDVDLFKLREKSVLRDRIYILQQGTVFHKTKALNEAVKYVKDPHSIIFTVDLHMKFPPNVFDNIRKHAVEGRSFYSPAVLKIKCGYSIAHQQAYWEMMGYGLFGGYKSDWGRFGGMDAEKFTTRWGGEDWDLMDRAIGAELEIERLRLPKFYHYYHERKSDWYEFARV